MGAFGISGSFPPLSRSSGQVAHVFRTRSPLGLLRCCHRMDPVRLACVRHAASVRPEPGSNSPSRSRTKRLPSRHFDLESRHRGYGPPPPTGIRNGKCCPLSNALNYSNRTRPFLGRSRLPALIFGCSFSVVKERRRDTLPYGRRCHRARWEILPEGSSHLETPVCRLCACLRGPLRSRFPLRSGSSY